MAFDFGLERIGVAIGNSLLKIPHPLVTISGQNKYDKLDKIADLIAKWQPQLLVVGIPSFSEEKEVLINSIKKFANRMHYRFKLPVELINEDYTSALAQNQLTEQNIRTKDHKNKLDQLAACAILAAYFTYKAS
jgi:putative Holliday junction resolvase